MRLLHPVWALVLLVAASAGVGAGEAGADGPLASLPSQPGPHVERIRALSNDSWLDLGPPAPDPKWGTARGRAWTPRMPYAPDLQAAFLCGCGQHGFVKPDGHFMDDLWAYDPNGHRWICAYPGAHVKSLALHLDEHGFEVDKDGAHIPVSFMGHGYCNQTYVAHLRRLMFAFTHSPWWTRAIPQRWTWLDPKDDDVRRRNYGHAGAVIESPRHPLFYDPAPGRWERRFVAGPGPAGRRFEGVLQYIPPESRSSTSTAAACGSTTPRRARGSTRRRSRCPSATIRGAATTPAATASTSGARSTSSPTT